MPRPESVFLVTSIWDADAPSEVKFVWKREEALAIVAQNHAYGAVFVEELHLTKGKRKILDYAPDVGLIEAEHYTTPTDRWTRGFPPDFVQKLLDQYPAAIANPWAGQR